MYKKMHQWLMAESGRKQFPLSDFQKIRHEIKQCDVLLIEGKSRVADVIKNITQSPWSHAALYLGRIHDIEDPLAKQKIKQFYDGQPDIQLLVESQLGLGTVIRPLHVYEKSHIRICRPSELSYKDGQTVIQYAVSQLGKAYDIRQILDLARFYAPWGVLPKRFRSSLFNWKPGGHTHTVCSTMIAEAFGKINYPILPLVKQEGVGDYKLFQRNPKLCTPSDFDYSPYFDIIKYPFMSFGDQKDESYRLLPWHGDIGLTDDEAQLYTEASDHKFIPPLHDTTERRIRGRDRYQ